jgi:predicted DCC family thiol-disulfide oxidoreductase YuxK
MLIAIAALTVGFFTPIANLLVLALYPHFDEIMQTSTLGTQMLLILLLFLVATQSGAALSVDRFLANRFDRVGALSRRLLSLFGMPGVRTFEASYLLLFASYALINCGAVLYHWQDEFWAAGSAIGVMETSAFFSRFFGFFRWQELHIHWLFQAMSQIAGLVTEFWQFFMVPLIFTKWGGRFVVFWGFTFGIVSAIFFQLSYLPYLELCVLVALFVNARRRHLVEVYYDDACSTCRRSVVFLNAINIPKALDLRPLSTSLDRATSHGISEADLYTRLHGVYRGRVYAGYDMCLLIARVTPLIIVYPLALLGKAGGVGPAAYEWIAARTRTSHSCQVLRPTDTRKRDAPRHGRWSLRIAVIAVWALAVSLYSLELSRVIFPAAKPDYVVGSWPIDQFKRFGLAVPIVFDYADLRDSQRWAVIYRIEPNGKRTEIPFNGVDGQRLSYYVDDQILYAASISWHFITVGATRQQFVALNQQGAEAQGFLQEVARYDYRRGGLSGNRRYTVDLYENHAADLTLSPKVRYRSERVAAVSFTVCLPSGTTTCAVSRAT